MVQVLAQLVVHVVVQLVTQLVVQVVVEVLVQVVQNMLVKHEKKEVVHDDYNKIKGIGCVGTNIGSCVGRFWS